MSTVEQRRYTEEFIEQIKEHCSFDFLNALRKTKKFLYLTGNTYHSVLPEWKEELKIWFNEKYGISLCDSIVVKNSTKMGVLDASIRTVPSFSTSDDRIIFILSFPKGDYKFCWSPIITSLNLVLKERSDYLKKFLEKKDSHLYNINELLSESIHKLMDSFYYNDTNLQLALYTGNEIHFSTPSDQWLFCYKDEVDVSLLKKFIKSTNNNKGKKSTT